MLFGEENLLIEESLDALRQRARASGVEERLSFLVGPGFDWCQLRESGQSLSLFASRRLLELRLPGGRPGDAGTKAFVEYCASINPDNTLVVICGRLDTNQRAAKWFTTLAGAGVAVEHRALSGEQFEDWLRARLARHKLRADNEVLRWLAYTLEGNLLAAAQEAEKLVLACPGGEVHMDTVLEQVADHARFTIFTLVETVLNGDLSKGLRILARLRGEGVEPILVLWNLVREVRTLAAMAGPLAAGQPRGRVFQKFNIWARRAPAVSAALARHQPGDWQALLRRLAAVDRQLKGRGPGLQHRDIWLALEHVCIELCVPGRAPHLSRAV